MGASRTLTVTDDLRATTLGELLDQTADGPLELRDAGGSVLATINGNWLTLGAPGPHVDLPWDPPPVTTE